MDLHVDGELPRHISGRHLVAGHTITLRDGVASGIRSTAPAPSGSSLVEFAGRLFSITDGSLARQLGADLDVVGVVDLAGSGRPIGVRPVLDTATGELHLLSSPGTTEALIHVVSPGSMTRRTRQLPDAPGPTLTIALTAEHVLAVGAGSVGLLARHEATPPTWYSVDNNTADVGAPVVVASHHTGDTTRLFVLTPALERWTLRHGNPVERLVIDPAPHFSGTCNVASSTGAPRFVYVGANDRAGVTKHDLATGRRSTFDLGIDRCVDEFVFVDDPHRAELEDGGWLLGFVHDDSFDGTDLVLLDASSPAAPPVAVVRLPWLLPRRLHAMWSPISR